MNSGSRWHRLKDLVRQEWQHLIAVNPSDRPWQMPVAAALASGVPLLIGAWFDRMDFGLVSSLGGLVFLYVTRTPLHHRMISVMACAFGFIVCYALGLLTHFVPVLLVPALTFISVLVTMVCRFYALGPPGSLFFIMVASIGAYTPVDVFAVPLRVGLLGMGTILACLIAFFYSLHQLRRSAPRPAPVLTPTFEFVVFDSVVIGVFVGISLGLAQLLGLEKAYWVPVGCLAVIQGASLRAVWNRQVHRVLGTGIGLLVAWALLATSLSSWMVATVVMGLTLVIEMTVVRHYAFATIFITPLTILLADSVSGHGGATVLIQARFLDTVLGCSVGLVGGICIHSHRFRTLFSPPLRALFSFRWPSVPANQATSERRER